MFKESDIVLSAKHIVKQFPASGGQNINSLQRCEPERL